jgi:hypothetical protein
MTAAVFIGNAEADLLSPISSSGEAVVVRQLFPTLL